MCGHKEGKGRRINREIQVDLHTTDNMYKIDAGYWMLGAGALGRPRWRVWGGSREEGSGWGTQVYLWQIHFDIWQN